MMMMMTMIKKLSVGIVNPVAKATLQDRKAPQVVLPKKGGKAKRNRRKDKMINDRNLKEY